MERLTKTSEKGGLAFAFDLDITCDRSEIEKIVKLGEKLKAYEDLQEECIELTGCGLEMLAMKYKEFMDDIAELYSYRQAEEQGLLIRQIKKWERIINPYGELEGFICECGYSDTSASIYCPSCGSKMICGWEQNTREAASTKE